MGKESAYKGSPEKSTEEALLERIATSDAVITGVVKGIPSPDYPSHYISEHNPDWKKAVIQLDAVMAGDIKRDKADKQPSAVTVLFPSSMDITWSQAPKFTDQQDGLWILRWEEIKEAGIKELTALHPLDYQPKANIAKVKKLIDSQKSGKSSKS